MTTNEATPRLDPRDCAHVWKYTGRWSKYCRVCLTKRFVEDVEYEGLLHKRWLEYRPQVVRPKPKKGAGENHEQPAQSVGDRA